MLLSQQPVKSEQLAIIRPFALSNVRQNLIDVQTQIFQSMLVLTLTVFRPRLSILLQCSPVVIIEQTVVVPPLVHTVARCNSKGRQYCSLSLGCV